MKRKPLTHIAHEKILDQLKTGDWAIDATAGNGHDTLFLAKQVGENGYVHAFDIQDQAIQTTAQQLKNANLIQRVSLHQVSHAQMANHLPSDWHNKVAVITFNLGYLPNGDKSITTLPDSTIAALEQSLSLLKPGGMLCILAYRGHAGGEAENLSIEKWLAQQENALAGEAIESPGPKLYFYIKADN